MAHYLMQFFVYDHLRPELQSVAQAFANLAGTIDTHLPNNPEKTTALQKLLEAKDCGVRAMVYVQPLDVAAGGDRAAAAST